LVLFRPGLIAYLGKHGDGDAGDTAGITITMLSHLQELRGGDREHLFSPAAARK
jgi:hypothetical protein